MKKLLILLVAGLACISTATAAEQPKPLVSLTAKRHLLDSDRDLRGKHGARRDKVVALRVEIVNISPSAIEGGELSGVALVMRVGEMRENIVSESLGKLKLPAIKPNEKITLDLGKLRLTEVEWRNRKFEETLEEWKITCSQGETEIGKAVSSDRFEKLEKDSTGPPKKDAKPVRKNPKRLVE